MSVPQSERRQSQVEYITILQQIEKFFITENLDEKRRVEGLSDELVKLSATAYNYATIYFEMCNGRVPGTIPQKKKYLNLTYWAARQIAAQINILMIFRMDEKRPTKGLQIKTQELLKVCNLLRQQLTQLNKEENKQ